MLRADEFMTKPAAAGPVPSTVIIAGAGIGGMTAALTLAAKGFDIVLCERAPDLTEVGAGLQMSPNASRVIGHVGALEKLMPAATPVLSIDLARASDGSLLLSLPTAKAAGVDVAPYLAVHRADLQSALLAQIEVNPRIKLLKNHVFEDARQDGNGVETEFMCNNRLVRLEGAALIGADGVWSQVRNLVNGANGAKHSGYMAWRATIPADEFLPASILRAVRRNRVVAFLAPGAHLVAYPLRNGTMVNLVLVTPGTDSPRGYDNPVDLELMETVMGQFEVSIGQMLREISHWRSWPLNGVAPEGAWVDGRIALLGDAAHAMTPFAAQGAAMAIEDAGVLANVLSANKANVPAALAAYEDKRRKRVCDVVARGRFNRFAYHLSGPAASARNLVFKMRGVALMHQLDWIFGYDALSA